MIRIAGLDERNPYLTDEEYNAHLSDLNFYQRSNNYYGSAEYKGGISYGIMDCSGSAGQWECAYCGTLHDNNAKHCKQCGAPQTVKRKYARIHAPNGGVTVFDTEAIEKEQKQKELETLARLEQASNRGHLVAYNGRIIKPTSLLGRFARWISR